MDLIQRAKNIVLQPAQEWVLVDKETGNAADLYTFYIIPLAATGPIASVIGLSIIGVALPMGGSYRVSLMSAIGHAVATFVLALVGTYMLALIIDALAPTFLGTKNKFPGSEAGGLFQHGRLARRNFQLDSGARISADFGFVQRVSPISWPACPDEGSSRKGSALYRRCDRRRRRHFRNYRRSQQLLHSLFHVQITRANEIAGRTLQIRRFTPFPTLNIELGI